MLAAAIPNPREVTVHWLRLAGIIALTMLGLSAFFWCIRGGPIDRRAILYGVVAALLLLDLAVLQRVFPKILQIAVPEFAALAECLASFFSLLLAFSLL